MTFDIKYAMVVRTHRGVEYIGNKEIKVKNQLNELGAKIALNDYLKRKYGENFILLEIESCKQDAFEKFSSMFGLKNPFGGFGL